MTRLTQSQKRNTLATCETNIENQSCSFPERNAQEKTPKQQTIKTVTCIADTQNKGTVPLSRRTMLIDIRIR